MILDKLIRQCALLSKARGGNITKTLLKSKVGLRLLWTVKPMKLQQKKEVMSGKERRASDQSRSRKQTCSYREAPCRAAEPQLGYRYGQDIQLDFDITSLIKDTFQTRYQPHVMSTF